MACTQRCCEVTSILKFIYLTPFLTFGDNLKTSITQMPRLLGSKKLLSAFKISSFGILGHLWEANSSQRQMEHF